MSTKEFVIHPVNSVPPNNTNIEFFTIPSRAGEGPGVSSTIIMVPIPNLMTDCWVVLDNETSPPKSVNFEKPVRIGEYINLSFNWHGGKFKIGIGFSGDINIV